MLFWLSDDERTPYQPGTVDPQLRSASLARAAPHPVMTAEEVMNSPVLSCAPDWPVGRALDLMRERGISHLPVVEDERVVGLVSDRDLLQHSKEAETRVRTIMTNRLLTARPQSNLWLVARIMLDEVVHCVVIVDEDANLRGILTSLDLLGCMSHHAPIEVWM